MKTNVLTPKKAATKRIVKAAKVIKVSDYTKNVINTNKNLKIEFKTLGGCLKQLWFFRDEMKMPQSYKTTVKLLREDSKAYETFKATCRTSKAGNYAPFFVLQAIHKSLK